MPDKEELDKVYYQRNMLAIMLAHLIHVSNITKSEAGWGVDGNEDWDDEWRTVVYINIPVTGDQMSFHMNPGTRKIAQRVLPEYHEVTGKKKGEEWDGTWWETHKERLLKYFG